MFYCVKFVLLTQCPNPPTPTPRPPPTMGNLIFMQKIIVIPHIFFLKYYKDIADLLFSVLWAPKVKSQVWDNFWQLKAL